MSHTPIPLPANAPLRLPLGLPQSRTRVRERIFLSVSSEEKWNGKEQRRKAFHCIISNDWDLSATVDYSLLTWSYFCSEDSLKIDQKVCTFQFLLK